MRKKSRYCLSYNALVVKNKLGFHNLNSLCIFLFENEITKHNSIIRIIIFILLEAQKRQWMASMSFSNDPNINPVTILYDFPITSILT
jgi:hypothetical protein